MLILLFSVLFIVHCTVSTELISEKLLKVSNLVQAARKVFFFLSIKQPLGATKTFLDNFYRGVIPLHGQIEVDFCSNLNVFSCIGENGSF